MTITCADLKEFLDVVAGLAERGIGFTAHSGQLTITLTGAY